MGLMRIDAKDGNVVLGDEMDATDEDGAGMRDGESVERDASAADSRFCLFLFHQTQLRTQQIQKVDAVAKDEGMRWTSRKRRHDLAQTCTCNCRLKSSERTEAKLYVSTG